MSDVLPDYPEFRICHEKAKYCNADGNGVYDADEQVEEEEAEDEAQREEL